MSEEKYVPSLALKSSLYCSVQYHTSLQMIKGMGFLEGSHLSVHALSPAFLVSITFQLYGRAFSSIRIYNSKEKINES